MKRLRGALLAGFAVVTALTGVAATVISTPAAAAQGDVSSSGYTFTVLDFNMAGNVKNHGRLGVADHVAHAIRNRFTRPRVATLQEVCGGQAQRIQNRLADLNYTVWFVPTTFRCDDGSRRGLALVYRGATDWRVQHTLPNPNNHTEIRKLICVKLSNSVIKACNTHIDHHDIETKWAQIREVAQLTKQSADNGRAVFVGGDFNLRPSRNPMDLMYRPAYGGDARGISTEAEGCCQRAGEATHDGGTKIDYIFVALQYYIVDYGDAVPTDFSDHHKYWGKFIVR